MATDHVLDGLRLNPDEVADREFAHGFRGYDVHEVRSYLRSVAGEMERLVDEAEMISEVSTETARGPVATENPSREQLVALVGDEAAGVLRAAEEASASIRARAEDSVDRMLREARTEAAQIRSSADQDRADLLENSEAARSGAQDKAAAIVAQAEVDAQLSRDAAVEQGKAMLAEAQEAREKVLRDLAKKRKSARRELAQLRAGIEQLHESYDHLRSMLDTSTSVVDGAVDDARRAAADAAHTFDRSDGEDDVAAVRLHVADVDVGAPRVGDDEAGPDTATGSEVVVDAGAVLDVETAPPGVDVVPSADDALKSREHLHREIYRREPAAAVASADSVADAEPETDTGSGAEIQSGTVSVAVPDAATSGEDFGEVDAPPEATVEDEPEPELPDGTAELPDLLDDGPVPPPPPAPKLFGRKDDNIDELFARIRTSRESAVAQAQQVLGEVDRSESDDEVGDSATESRPGKDELFAELDAAHDALDGDVARVLKRALADELNEVLDASRRADAVNSVADLIPEASIAEYGRAVEQSLAVAAARGSGDQNAKVDIESVVDMVSREIGAALQKRIAGFIDDQDELDQRIRSVYREWRRDRADDVAGIAVASAFNLGVLSTLGPDESVGWTLRDGTCSYPDCGDNALATDVRAHGEFPTGHLIAPIGPGCRCLVMAADQ